MSADLCSDLVKFLLVDQEGIKNGEFVGLLDIEVHNKTFEGQLDLADVGGGRLQLCLHLHKALNLRDLQVGGGDFRHVDVDAPKDLDIRHVFDHLTHLCLVVHHPDHLFLPALHGGLYDQGHLSGDLLKHVFLVNLLNLSLNHQGFQVPHHLRGGRNPEVPEKQVVSDAVRESPLLQLR